MEASKERGRVKMRVGVMGGVGRCGRWSGEEGMTAVTLILYIHLYTYTHVQALPISVHHLLPSISAFLSLQTEAALTTVVLRRQLQRSV